MSVTLMKLENKIASLEYEITMLPDDTDAKCKQLLGDTLSYLRELHREVSSLERVPRNWGSDHYGY